jgi:hypothetical protein
VTQFSRGMLGLFTGLGCVGLLACVEVTPVPVPVTCTPGTIVSCTCDDGAPGQASCRIIGSPGACVCGNQQAPDDSPGQGSDSDNNPGDGSGGNGNGPDTGDSEPGGDGDGDGDNPAPGDGDGAQPGDGDGAQPGDGDGDADPADPFASLRQVCVDTINAYRASVNLPPLKRKSLESEQCSDKGAEHDSKRYSASGKAHESASASVLPCRKDQVSNRYATGVAQNSCPNYPYGGWYGTQEQALKTCLKQMWEEGPPPGGGACSGTCFLAHGHYINMTGNHTYVSCGFYETGNGRIYMNQDFFN